MEYVIIKIEEDFNMGNFVSFKDTISPEELISKLKDTAKLRNQMGGAMYWNILNDDCCEIANKCIAAGCDRQEIEKILGEGTFR
jgi:hypothetical protein